MQILKGLAVKFSQKFSPKKTPRVASFSEDGSFKKFAVQLMSSSNENLKFSLSFLVDKLERDKKPEKEAYPEHKS